MSGKDLEFKYSDDLRKELNLIDAQITNLQAEKKFLKRKAARKSGLTAEKLENLKSESGLLFIEDEYEKYSQTLKKEPPDKTRERVFPYCHGYEQKKIKTASTTKHRKETAYFCGTGFPENADGCGWVIGAPNSEEFNTLATLSGSVGVNHYCHICGNKVGELTWSNSLS